MQVWIWHNPYSCWRLSNIGLRLFSSHHCEVGRATKLGSWHWAIWFQEIVCLATLEYWEFVSSLFKIEWLFTWWVFVFNSLFICALCYSSYEIITDKTDRVWHAVELVKKGRGMRQSGGWAIEQVVERDVYYRRSCLKQEELRAIVTKQSSGRWWKSACLQNVFSLPSCSEMIKIFICAWAMHIPDIDIQTRS